jgi:hypothetical protein
MFPVGLANLTDQDVMAPSSFFHSRICLGMDFIKRKMENYRSQPLILESQGLTKLLDHVPYSWPGATQEGDVAFQLSDISFSRNLCCSLTVKSGLSLHFDQWTQTLV